MAHRPLGTSQQREQLPVLPGVEHILLVASGKGGVGKSTVAANLAQAMALDGKRVGLLDADIYGPSMPIMFGITERPSVDGQMLKPFEKYGIKLMSLGFMSFSGVQL